MATEREIIVAGRIWQVLIDLAKRKETLRYGELITEAKKKFPNEALLQTVVPVHIGRILGIIMEFTTKHNLPHITALARDSKNGVAKMPNPTQANTTMVKCFSHNWDIVPKFWTNLADMQRPNFRIAAVV